MRKHIYLFLFFLIIGIVANAQSILVSGKVLELNTNNPIANATIKCGNFGTSSIKDGSFRLVLNQDIVNQLGLTISCLGFETKTVKYIPDLKVYLKPSNLMLNEVIVGIDGKSILEKAIDRIEVNYPQKDFTMTGFIKMHQIAKNDTADFKFFKNEAIVSVGVTSYKKNATDSKVKLLQNRNLLKDSLKNEENYVRFVSGYLMPANGDYVHNRSRILNPNELKKYEYYLSGMTSINGRRTYTITFNSLKKNDNEGIVYIDSASFAIVRINSTAYNFKPFGSIPINEASRTINYQKIKDKWYLNNIRSNTNATLNNINYSRFEEYHTIAIDSNKLDVNYIDVIQDGTEDLTINNLVEKQQWNKFEPFIDSLRSFNLISEINPPIVAENYKPEKLSFEKSLTNKFRTYLVNGGFRSFYKMSQSYVTIDGFQPLINKNVSQIANYNITIGTQFKLYKNLFYESSGTYNFGIGGLRTRQNDYLLTYNFVFNKTHHPLTVATSFGYSNFEVGKKKEQYYYQESTVYKLGFVYEQKRQLSYIISTALINPFYERNNGINYENVNYVTSIGIVKRF